MKPSGAFPYYSANNNYGSVSASTGSPQDYRSRAGSDQSSGRGSASGMFTSTGRRDTVGSGCGIGRSRSDFSGYENIGGNRNRKQKDRAVVPEDESTGPKLACPYFQRDPAHHRLERSCAGPGFPTIPRLKEHLYRRHMCFVCERCRKQFYKQADLDVHLRETQSCPISSITPDRQNGFGKPEEASLRAKKRNMQWEDVYKILFPEDEEIPSPYYSTTDVERLHNYQSQLRRTIRESLPMIIQRQFSHFGPDILSELMTRLPDVVCLFIDERFPSSSAIATSPFDHGTGSAPILFQNQAIPTNYHSPTTQHQPPQPLHPSMGHDAAISPGTRLSDLQTPPQIHQLEHQSADTHPVYSHMPSMWSRSTVTPQQPNNYMTNIYPIPGPSQDAASMEYGMTSVPPGFNPNWQMSQGQGQGRPPGSM